MPLSILVSIVNIKKHLFFILCFIILELTFIFKFIKKQLDKLFFYNLLYLKITYSDFTKSLAKAIIILEIQ